MRFAKTKAMLSVNALKYTIEHLLMVAFPTEKPLPYRLDVSGLELRVTVADSFTMSFCLLSDDEVVLLRKGVLSVEFVRSDVVDTVIPLFKSEEVPVAGVNYEEAARLLHIPFDLVTLPFLLLSKSDERDGSPRDQHGRFQFAYSMAKAFDFVDVPLVDVYALMLRQWVLQYVEVPFRWEKRVPKIVPTHDIDLACRFHSSVQAFKSIFGRDLILERSLQNAIVSCREYKDWKRNTENDPYLLAIHDLKNLALDNEKNAVFFFKAQQQGEHDATYSISDPVVQLIIRQLLDSDMIVGLHGSYDSLDDVETLYVEKKRLEAITGVPVDCGRQHYLRFNSERSLTVRMWQQVGIGHDYTLGYAERPGFRCGTCHPYPLYDLENDCPTCLIEHPLIVMDGTLIDYMKLDVEDGVAVMRKLQRRCAMAEGDFVFLWHNHTTRRGFRPYYEQCVKTIFK